MKTSSFNLLGISQVNDYEHWTHSDALPHDAGLLHTARPAKLLHVFTEMALSALRPQARLALPTASPSPPGTRCSPTGWQLDCWCRRSCHLRFRPVGRPRLMGWRGYSVMYLKWKVKYFTNRHKAKSNQFVVKWCIYIFFKYILKYRVYVYSYTNNCICVLSFL